MLILTRKLGESIQIGNDIKITLLEEKGKQIRIGIEAPDDVAIYREEVYKIIQEQNIMAASYSNSSVTDLFSILDDLKKQKKE